MTIEYTEKWFKANSEKFNDWFDSDYYDWRYSYMLAAHCSKDFDKWFDPETYFWVEDCDYLTIFCSKYFKKWWDPDKFDWEYCKLFLVGNCIAYIDIWYDPKEFDESYDELLIKSIRMIEQKVGEYWRHENGVVYKVIGKEADYWRVRIKFSRKVFSKREYIVSYGTLSNDTPSTEDEYLVESIQ